MAGLAGKDGDLKIGSDSMTEVQGWTLDASTDLLDDSALGDEWKTNVPALSEWSANIEVSWLMSDTAQVAVQNAYLTKATVTVKLYTNSTNYYSGSANIESMNVSAQVNDLVKATMKLKGTGALSYT